MDFFIWLIVVGVVAIMAWKMPDDRNKTGGNYESSIDKYM